MLQDIIMKQNLDDQNRLILPNVLKIYKGVEYKGSNIPKKYNHTYKPQEVENRWEKIESEKILKCEDRDIIHQIKTPINTKGTLYINSKKILEINLRQNIPFVIDLPLCALTEYNINLTFEPSTYYEQTYINFYYNDENHDKLIHCINSGSIINPILGFACENGIIYFDSCKLSSNL
jgi:hypothetical protein